MTLEQAIGFGAAITFIVGLIKKFNLIPDGYAGLVAVALNAALAAFLQISQALCNTPDAYCPNVAGIDSFAGALAQIGALALPFLLQLGGSYGMHKVARGLIPKGTPLLPFGRRTPHD